MPVSKSLLLFYSFSYSIRADEVAFSFIACSSDGDARAFFSPLSVCLSVGRVLGRRLLCLFAQGRPDTWRASLRKAAETYALSGL